MPIWEQLKKAIKQLMAGWIGQKAHLGLAIAKNC